MKSGRAPWGAPQICARRCDRGSRAIADICGIRIPSKVRSRSLSLSRGRKFEQEEPVTSFPIFGGCICEGVKYKVKGAPRRVVHCHCSQCRRSYASLVGTGATIEHEQIEIVNGKENLTTYEFSPTVRRQFCKICGCSILYYDDSFPEVVFYYPATLDDGKHPGHQAGTEHHVFTDSRASWEAFNDDLPRHAEGSVNADPGTSAT